MPCTSYHLINIYFICSLMLPEQPSFDRPALCYSAVAAAAVGKVAGADAPKLNLAAPGAHNGGAGSGKCPMSERDQGSGCAYVCIACG